MEAELARKIREAQDAYYNRGSSRLTDQEYDALVSELEAINPNNPALSGVGAAVDGESVKLPRHMGSLEKKNSEATLARALAALAPADRFVLSDKLDGLSALLHLSPGGVRMYTRGDGTRGKDVTRLLKGIRLGAPLKSLREGMKREGLEFVRGELILELASFPGKTGEELRSKAVGIINSTKNVSGDASKIHFLAYEACGPSGCDAPSKQFAALRRAGFAVPQHRQIERSRISYSSMVETLVERNAASPFGIDGVVVAADGAYSTGEGKYPKHAFAFKSALLEHRAVTKVKDVEWNVSKNGVLFPTVVFERVNLGGSSVDRASGKNAKFVTDNDIGVGAEIVVAMAGKIIPDIRQVRKGSSKIPLPRCGHAWNPSGVNYVATGDDCDTGIASKKVAHLFEHLPAFGYGLSAARKLVSAGITGLEGILAAPDSQIRRASITNGSLLKKTVRDGVLAASPHGLAYAASVFGPGIGISTIKTAMDSGFKKAGLLRSLPGIGPKTAKELEDGLRAYGEMSGRLAEMGLKPRAAARSSGKAKTGRLDVTVVFTGFRDKGLEKKLVDAGGRIAPNVTSQTTHVVVNSAGTDTGKTKEAAKRGIPVITDADLRRLISKKNGSR